ncbi:ABC-2 transporter permease [Priestia flexa]|uniref:ABC-2 transporter permease n=1 Tax=Priestia flexa TaxID=86664 RepID=UPI001B3454AF|nr:ABC-2 transporter permease [Priestia flexa]
MIQLIRKDFLLQRNVFIILLPILFIYLLIDTSTTWVGIIFSIALIMNAFSEDEKSAVRLLLNSLPYTRKEIVSAKYLCAFLFAVSTLLVIAISNRIIHGEGMQWAQLVFSISVVLIFVSIAFPVSYIFHSKYLGIAFIGLFVIYIIIANTFVHNLQEQVINAARTIMSFNVSDLYLLVLLPALLLYLLSWLTSIFIYKQKTS